jgi:hypothetical protein
MEPCRRNNRQGRRRRGDKPRRRGSVMRMVPALWGSWVPITGWSAGGGPTCSSGQGLRGTQLLWERRDGRGDRASRDGANPRRSAPTRRWTSVLMTASRVELAGRMFRGEFCDIAAPQFSEFPQLEQLSDTAAAIGSAFSVGYRHVQENLEFAAAQLLNPANWSPPTVARGGTCCLQAQQPFCRGR